MEAYGDSGLEAEELFCAFNRALVGLSYGIGTVQAGRKTGIAPALWWDIDRRK
jgi:hypothetical protein